MIAKYMNILDAVLCQSLDQHCVTCCGHNFLTFSNTKKGKRKHSTLIAMLPLMVRAFYGLTSMLSNVSVSVLTSLSIK